MSAVQILLRWVLHGDHMSIDDAATIAMRTLDQEAEIERGMSEVLAYIENEQEMTVIELEEELLNTCMVIDEETGKEVCFDPIWMYFCEVSNSTLYATNTDKQKSYDEMFPKLC